MNIADSLKENYVEVKFVQKMCKNECCPCSLLGNLVSSCNAASEGVEVRLKQEQEPEQEQEQDQQQEDECCPSRGNTSAMLHNIIL